MGGHADDLTGDLAGDPFGLLPGGSWASAQDGAAELLLETLAGETDGPPPDRSDGGAVSGDICAACACPLIIRELCYECPQCHAVREAADYADVQPQSVASEAGDGALRGRLRVVGAESAWFQPDLDRTNPGDYCEMQKKTTYAELRRLNEEYRGRGGNPFPLNVLSDVAETYNVIQQMSVKRSMMKRSILSALLFHACISRGFTRTKAEVAEFAKLRNHGIARGDDYIRSVDEDRGLAGLDMNHPRLFPHIETTFSELELEGPGVPTLRAAVCAIVRRADAELVGIRSVLRSKVIASTCEVLVRAESRRPLSARPPLSQTLATVASRCGIRRHTIVRFRRELADYHSVFADIYAAHGLPSERIEHLDTRPPAALSSARTPARKKAPAPATGPAGSAPS